MPKIVHGLALKYCHPKFCQIYSSEIDEACRKKPSKLATAGRKISLEKCNFLRNRKTPYKVIICVRALTLILISISCCRGNSVDFSLHVLLFIWFQAKIISALK